MFPQSKPIHFPAATTLSDLFESFEIRPAAESSKTVFIGDDWLLDHGGSIRGVGGFRCFHATPKQEIVEWVKSNMLRVEYDTIYFEITIRSDGTALICAKYNQIIGDRYLAVIDADYVRRVGGE